MPTQNEKHLAEIGFVCDQLNQVYEPGCNHCEIACGMYRTKFEELVTARFVSELIAEVERLRGGNCNVN